MGDRSAPTHRARQIRAPLLALAFVALAALTSLHPWLREAIFDARFKAIGRSATGTVALIEIDPKSIEAIGYWPWRRNLHGELLRQLEKAEVSDIAFDVDFSSTSSPDDDAAFAEALRAAGGSVILPVFRQRVAAGSAAGDLHINRPLPPFSAESWLALVDVRPDADGIARHYNFGDRIAGTFIPSMGAILGGRQEEGGSTFRIDYGIAAASVPRVSYVDVLRGTPSALAALKGRKVIVSGTAAELGDRLNVPNGAILPGSLVLALAAESILQDRALVVTSSACTLAGLAGIVILMALVWNRLRVGWLMALLAALAAATEGSALLLQSRSPVLLDTSLVLVAILAYALAAVIDEIDLRGILRLVAERRFQRITLALSDGLVCTDGEGRITFWNPAASTMFGYGAAEWKGRRFEFLLAPGEPSARRFDLTAFARDTSERVAGTLFELKGRRSSGESFDLECSVSTWDAPGGIQYGVVLRDISPRKRQEERLRFLAECDVLTGLPNRHSLLTRLDAERTGPATLLLVGINRFNHLAHLRGASFVDRLLSAIAQRLTTLRGPVGFVARLSDDEFALIAPADHADALGERIAAHFRDNAITVEEGHHRISVSVGMAEATSAQSREEWLGNAQLALFAAQSASLSEPMRFAAPMRQAIETREALEIALRQALKQDEFELFYQPQFDLRTGRIVGAEALIRWRHPERGIVAPGEFMPVVNTTSLAEDFSAWVMVTAFRQAASWFRAGHRVRVGINLSQVQFDTGDLVATVDALLSDHRLPPELIELEITEDIILEDSRRTSLLLAELRRRSISVAFDDFGTGYGSLTYLKKFPIDTIKIDQIFVRTLAPDTDDASIVRTTIDLGHALGLSVIAEGIESEATLDILRAWGCDEGQGYFFSKPVPAEVFEIQFLAETAALV